MSDPKPMKKIGVFTSGGDSPGMNACLRAVVRTATAHGVAVIGIRRGYEGMIAGDFQPLETTSVSNILQRGGTILQSARCPEFHTIEGRKKAFSQLQKNDIEGLVAIGGDGTFSGLVVFEKEHGVPGIGVPGTIDNDLYGTDLTIGFDTAVSTVVDAIDKIRDTADSHNRLFFVQVMGRDSGHIALESGLAGGAEAILLPEADTDIQVLIDHLRGCAQRGKKSGIVIVAEGDDAGDATVIANSVKAQFDEYDTRVIVIGHLQRGGSPSYQDRILATQLGHGAVNALLSGEYSRMIGRINGEIVFTELSTAIQHRKDVVTQLPPELQTLVL